MACSQPKYYDSVRDWQGRLIPIPCHYCLCCRLDDQYLMQQRLQAEYVCSGGCAFVTFTYDDDHLYFREGYSLPSLNRWHVHKYIDKIRHTLQRKHLHTSRSSSSFSYYLCGEYGDKFNRPHYHALFFNLDFWECMNFFKDSWKYGSVKVLPVKNGSIRYVTKYMSKNQTPSQVQKQYYDVGLLPPFSSWSRGLGSCLFYAHKDEIARYGYMIIGSRHVPVPVYYRNKFLTYDSDTLDWMLAIDRERVSRLKSEMQRIHYVGSVDEFIVYKRQQKENIEYKRMLNKDEATDDYLVLERNSHSHGVAVKLASQALEV